MIEIDNKTLGVIVARMQVPELHEGHKYLIDYVKLRYPNYAILVGVSDEISIRNPLTFDMRKKMIQALYPKARIVGVSDHPGDDEMWSMSVDDIIASIKQTTGCSKAILFGSRDSFVPYYRGKNSVEEISPKTRVPSGSDLRTKIYRFPLDSPDFRAGVIWASQFLNK